MCLCNLGAAEQNTGTMLHAFQLFMGPFSFSGASRTLSSRFDSSL
jgi:hypothetical protein